MRLLMLLVLCCSLAVAAQVPVLTVGHVGHDHHLALYLAAERGADMRPLSGDVWLRPLKEQAVYELLRGEAVVAQLNLQLVKGGAGMPASLSRGDIDIGFGGLAPTVLAIDKGARLKVLAPCNADGDMLLLGQGLQADSWPAFVELVRERERPLRIGYKAPLAVAYLIFKKALEEEGLRHGPRAMGDDGEPVDVVLIDLKTGSNMIPGLAGGSVDGMVMNQPVIAVAEEKGLGAVVCDLRELPPAGAWERHPCCCVAGTERVCAAHPQAVQALLQVVVAAGRLLENDPTLGVPVAVKWCNKGEAVERRSVPTVSFVSSFDAEWLAGETIWFRMMEELGVFTGRLAGLDHPARRARVVDQRLLDAALGALPARETHVR